MKILHTSDWHLGQHFIHKERKAEHKAFLNWLLEQLDANSIDLLIVAGDIFDTGTPPNYAQELYYTFLSKIRETCCRNVVIVGGNHDSVSMLRAPKILLKYMNIHVVERISGEPDEDIIEIRGPDNEVTGLVCAVPFLRDRDIRKSVPGESYAEKSKALIEGVKIYYRKIFEKVLERMTGLDKKVPLIATGHLFAAGGEVSDGVREIYVGSLGKINADSFPREFDYLALGHLHKPQVVGKKQHIRYSGSPIPLSFSEAGSPKQVVLVELNPGWKKPDIDILPVPEFQKLLVLKGSPDKIEKELKQLEDPGEGKKIWLEVQISMETWKPGADGFIKELCADLPVELFAIKLIHETPVRQLKGRHRIENLDHLRPGEVFERRMELEGEMEEETKDTLRQAFNEVLAQVHQTTEDRN